MPEIVCLGVCVVDALGKPIDEVPEKGKLVLFDRMELHTGGCAANTAITLSRMGVDVLLMGRIGKDGLGDFFLNHLNSCGVNVENIVRDGKVSTSFTFVMISSDGQRTFYHSPGADGTFCIDDVDLDVVRNVKIVHIGGALVLPTFDGEQMARVLREAKKTGVITSVDTAYNDRLSDCNKVLAPSYPYMDFFQTSVEEGKRISGFSDHKKIGRFLKDNGCNVVIIKMGEKGSYLLSDLDDIEVPSYPVEIADTCGAGDAFAGGFLVGILKGWSLEESVRFGNAVGACCVEKVGATAGIPSFQEVRNFQKQSRRATDTNKRPKNLK